MSEEVKLTKEEVQANIVQMLQQVEYWQDVVDNWPSDAKYLILKQKGERRMKLYTTGQGHWAGTQADARKVKKDQGLFCVLYDVPVSKQELSYLS